MFVYLKKDFSGGPALLARFALFDDYFLVGKTKVSSKVRLVLSKNSLTLLCSNNQEKCY